MLQMLVTNVDLPKGSNVDTPDNENGNFKNLIEDKYSEQNSSKNQKDEEPKEELAAVSLANQPRDIMLDLKKYVNVAEFVNVAEISVDSIDPLALLSEVNFKPEAENQNIGIMERFILKNATENPTAEEIEFVFSKANIETADTEGMSEKDISKMAEDLAKKILSDGNMGTSSEGDQLFDGSDSADISAYLFKDVENAPIKVSEPTQILNTESETFGQDLLKSIETSIADGLEKVTIKLAPESLGNVTIEITKDVNGIINVVLNADSELGNKALKETLPMLNQALSSQNSEVKVMVLANENAPEHQNLDHNGNGQNKREREKEKETSDEFIQKLRLGMLNIV